MDAKTWEQRNKASHGFTDVGGSRQDETDYYSLLREASPFMTCGESFEVPKRNSLLGLLLAAETSDIQETDKIKCPSTVTATVVYDPSPPPAPLNPRSRRRLVSVMKSAAQLVATMNDEESGQ